MMLISRVMGVASMVTETSPAAIAQPDLIGSLS